MLCRVSISTGCVYHLKALFDFARRVWSIFVNAVWRCGFVLKVLIWNGWRLREICLRNCEELSLDEIVSEQRRDEKQRKGEEWANREEMRNRGEERGGEIEGGQSRRGDTNKWCVNILMYFLMSFEWLLYKWLMSDFPLQSAALTKSFKFTWNSHQP